MEFESVEQAAKRLQVTTRTVQKWAKEGKIPGVSRMGHTWLIPCEFVGQAAVVKKIMLKEAAVTEAEIGGAECVQVRQSILRPLMDGAFELGQCLNYIMSFPEGIQREVLTFQYYYFCGQPEKVVELAEPYLEHENLAAALSASVMYAFANLNLGNTHLFRRGQEYIRKYAQICMTFSQNPEAKAYAVYFTTMMHVLLHIECPPIPPLERELQYLPMGIRLHAGYLMAQEAYLEKDYGRCLGIAEMALALCGDTYVIPAIYLHLMASIALMNLRRIVEAKSQFEQAWQLARADGLLAVFGEHIGMLQGLLEVSLKKQYPEEYAIIMKNAVRFVDEWRKVRDRSDVSGLVDQLTPVEMTIASLFHRGWTVKEISAYMEISPRMVRHHISTVYEKLGISHREELAQYVVR